jgi:hypothetical protein
MLRPYVASNFPQKVDWLVVVLVVAALCFIFWEVYSALS